MVTVRFFGSFRLDSGIKILELEAERVRELYPLIAAEAKRRNPGGEFSEEKLKGCIVTVNGKAASGRTKLCNGDVVLFASAVAGG